MQYLKAVKTFLVAVSKQSSNCLCVLSVFAQLASLSNIFIQGNVNQVAVVSGHSHEPKLVAFGRFLGPKWLLFQTLVDIYNCPFFTSVFAIFPNFYLILSNKQKYPILLIFII